MKKSVLYLLMLLVFSVILAVVSYASAPPELPTFFYGGVIDVDNSPAKNKVVEAEWSDTSGVKHTTAGTTDEVGNYFFVEGTVLAAAGTTIVLRSEGVGTPIIVSAAPGHLPFEVAQMLKITVSSPQGNNIYGGESGGGAVPEGAYTSDEGDGAVKDVLSKFYEFFKNFFGRAKNTNYGGVPYDGEIPGLDDSGAEENASSENITSNKGGSTSSDEYPNDFRTQSSHSGGEADPNVKPVSGANNTGVSLENSDKSDKKDKSVEEEKAVETKDSLENTGSKTDSVNNKNNTILNQTESNKKNEDDSNQLRNESATDSRTKKTERGSDESKRNDSTSGKSNTSSKEKNNSSESKSSDETSDPAQKPVDPDSSKSSSSDPVPEAVPVHISLRNALGAMFYVFLGVIAIILFFILFTAATFVKKEYTNYSSALDLQSASETILSGELFELMTKNVLCVNKMDDLKQVVSAMDDNEISTACVVDKDTLIGTISEHDLIKKVDPSLSMQGLKVKDVMSFNASINTSTTTKVIDAVRIMKKNNVRKLPVLSKNAVAGIVTQTDLASHLVNEKITKPIQKMPLTPGLSKIMSRKIICVTRDATVKEATDLMKVHNISCIVVVESETVLGIFTEKDYAYNLMKDARKLKGKIGSVMSRPVFTINLNKNIIDAHIFMHLKGYRHLVVMDGDKMVGIVTQTDLFYAVTDFLYGLSSKRFKTHHSK